MPDDWAKMIVNQLIEAQRMWLEMTTQQTALVFKTVSEVMGMSHKTRPVFGVQFHPESIASEHGHAMIANFLSAAGLR